VALSIAGGLLGFLASSLFPYGWLITYPVTGMILGALLAAWILWPWEDPRDGRSRLWQRMPEATRGRVAELDALRGIAVAMVCGCHLWPESRIFFCGWSGVDLFFVLSGYLITQIILRNGQEPGFLRAFYVRRTLRIWPVYYLTLMVIIAFAPWLARSRGWVVTSLGYYLTYSQNLFVSQIPHDSVYRKCYGPTWSLALEEQFYLIWPALVLLLPRRGLPLVAIGWIVVSCGTRGRGPELDTLVGRGDGLALGGLLAYMLNDRQRMCAALGKYRLGFGLVTIAVLVVLTMMVLNFGRRILAYPPEPPSLGLLLLDLLFFGVIGLAACFAGHPAICLLRDRRIVGLGVISYGVYIYHLPVFRLVEGFSMRFGLGDRLDLDLAKLALSVLTAALSWKVFEQPILSLKKRFAYSGGSHAGRAAD
jgi:peptidoglycan/LPS O-acetylase OafA/YrhL